MGEIVQNKLANQTKDMAELTKAQRKCMGSDAEIQDKLASIKLRMAELRREMIAISGKAQRKCVESDSTAIREKAASIKLRMAKLTKAQWKCRGSDPPQPARPAAEQRCEIYDKSWNLEWNLRDIIEHTLRRGVERGESPDISWDDVAEYLKTKSGVKKNPAILEQVRTAFEESVSRMQ